MPHRIPVVLAVLLASAPASAEDEASASPHTFTANIGLFSDYVFRGITNSNEEPAVQGGFDYAHESGLYAGVWASNVDFDVGPPSDDAAVEVDVYGGMTGSFANGIGWDLGFIYYAYPGQNEDAVGGADYDYYEAYGKLSYSFSSLTWTPSVEIGLYYSPDEFGDDGEAVYEYGTFGLTLPCEFNPYVTIGHQYVAGDKTTGPEGYDYVHYAVGVSKTLGQFTADLSWQDARDLSGCGAKCEAVVFSVTATF